MVISRKPIQKKDDVLVDQIIEKGGSTPSTKTEENKDRENIKLTIRLPGKMLHAIDTHLKNSIYTKPRNTWIQEAIERKIKEEIDISS